MGPIVAAAFGLLLLAGCSSKGDPTGPGGVQDGTPPTANAGGPYAAVVGTALTLDGSQSKDPQGQTLTYSWTFGDGGTGTGVKPSYTYSAPSDYVVSLIVADTSSLSSPVAETLALVSLPAPGGTNGVVYNGRQPIVGAHVYVLAANTTGYGQPSVSVMSASATGHADAIGAYLLTGADGGFSWAEGPPTCTPGSQMYVYAQGGSVGGVSNPAIGLMASLGTCPSTGSLVALPYVWVNEVSTVAAAYGVSGFATDSTHVSSSGTPAALVGIANAFATPANLASPMVGIAYIFTPSGNGLVPQAAINTLADILSVCVASGSASSGSCTTLFGAASAGGVPADTATAAIHIAHAPGANIAGLYGLMPSSPPFGPILTQAPIDFTLSVGYIGGCMNVPQGIALDSTGNVWVTNLISSCLSEFTPMGAAISSYDGYTGGGLRNPAAIAFDLSGNAWVANLSGGESEFSGYSAVSPAAGFPICAGASSHGLAVDAQNRVWFANSSGYPGVYNVEGLQNAGCISMLSSSTGGDLGNYGAGYLDGPFGIAIDSAGNVWVTNQLGNSLTELSSSGMPISPLAGYTGGGLNVPDSLAIDASDNVWVVNAGNSTLSEFSKTGTAMSPPGGYVGGGLARPESLAIDGAGNVWVANSLGNSLSEFSNAGAVLSPAGFPGTGMNEPNGLAIDASGNVWVTSAEDNALVEYVGAAVPVVMPLAQALKGGQLGARP